MSTGARWVVLAVLIIGLGGGGVNAAGPLVTQVPGTGYPFFATAAGSTSVYHERTVSNGRAESDCFYTLTVLGSAAFPDAPGAVRVLRAYDGEDDLAYWYFQPVSAGLTWLGEEWGSRSSPETLVRRFDPAPTYPLLKAGETFATRQQTEDGGSFTLTFRALQAETVTVPAGTFDALKVEVTWSTEGKRKRTDTYWLGPAGIGAVKVRTVEASWPESVWYQETELEAHT